MLEGGGVRLGRTPRVTPEGHEAFELSFHYFREHRAHMKRLLADLELTPMQMHALRALEPGQPQPMVSLSQKLFCDPPNVTPVVDKLEALGLVTRVTSPQDRRIKSVLLTAAGEALRTRVLSALREPPRLISALSADDQRLLRDLLRKMIDSIEEPAKES